jgi:hypothetical protein
MGADLLAQLRGFGFATIEGNTLRKSCRLLERFVQEQRADQGSVARLFHTAEGYQANIRSILEPRLAQLPTVDAELRRAIARCAGDLPDSPAQALGNMRNIAERAFALIWSVEFGEGRKIPSPVFGHRRDRGIRGLEPFERLQIPVSCAGDAGSCSCWLVQSRASIGRQDTSLSRAIVS